MQRVAILYDASQAVLSTFDLDEALSRILAIVRDYFNLRAGAILLLDPETQELRIRAHFGIQSVAADLRIKVGDGITGAAAKQKRPIYVPDISKEPRYMTGAAGTRSELAIPLMVGDEVAGVLDCQSDIVAPFDRETVDLLTLFATQASMGLQNARLHSLERRRAAQLEGINAIAKQTTVQVELPILIERLCAQILELFGLDYAAIFLRDDDGKLALRAEKGSRASDRPLAEDGNLAEHEGMLSPRNPFVLPGPSEASEVVLVNKVAAREDGPSPRTRPEMDLQLVSSGENIGALRISSGPEAFLANEVQALESVTDILATAIQNARYVQKIQELAYRDGLTGTFNRRYFEVHLLEELERAKRYGGGLSMLMIDLDHFKAINDEFGHLLGDEVLRQISGAFARHLRKLDVMCRYGGEEFAVIIPSTVGENALMVAEKLRRAVAGWNFPGVPRPVTISVGVAEYPMHGENRDALVSAADAALYAAKQKGRNRVEMAALDITVPSSDQAS